MYLYLTVWHDICGHMSLLSQSIIYSVKVALLYHIKGLEQQQQQQQDILICMMVISSVKALFGDGIICDR